VTCVWLEKKSLSHAVACDVTRDEMQGYDGSHDHDNHKLGKRPRQWIGPQIPHPNIQAEYNVDKVMRSHLP